MKEDLVRKQEAISEASQTEADVQLCRVVSSKRRIFYTSPAA
jgi:hypothetical protein